MKLSQFCSKPEPRHYAAAKRVLRYLKGSKHPRLRYNADDMELPLKGYTDSDWAGNVVDRTSTSGYLWTLSGAPISWSAKKQTSIALSSTEAEYVAMTRAVQEGLWLRQALDQMNIPRALSLPPCR